MRKSHRIKAVIFDLWKTLISSFVSEKSDEIIKMLNLSGRKEFWNGVGTVSIRPIEKMDEVIMGFCKAVKRENKFNLIKKILKDLESKTIVFDDVIPTLSFLKEKKLKLGLITNTDKPAFLIAAKRLNFEKFFDVITTSFETGLLKPNPKIFYLTVKKLGLRFGECMMVGDNPEDDISTPQKLGMVTVLVNRKNQYIEKPQNVDYLIKSLSELPILTAQKEKIPWLEKEIRL